MSDRESVGYEWVMARYEGKKAKFALDSSGSAARGYYVIESGTENREPWALVAFKRPLLEFRPLHLDEITDRYLIEKLERWADPFYKENKNTKPYGEMNNMFPQGGN